MIDGSVERVRGSLRGRRSFGVRLVIGSGSKDGRSGWGKVSLISDVVLDRTRIGSRRRVENRFQRLTNDDGRRGEVIRRAG